MYEFELSSLSDLLGRFVPSLRISSSIQDCTRVRREHEVHSSEMHAGSHRVGRDLFIWYDLDPDHSAVFHFSRENIPLTKAELGFLLFASDVLAHLRPGKSEWNEANQIQRLSARNVFGTAVIAKYLQNKRGDGFWTPSFLISQLQLLAMQSYESSAATSGFIMLPKSQDMPRVIQSNKYQFDQFVTPILVREHFFRNPVSYRYVDGRNSFYVVDRHLRVTGICRISDPSAWSPYDRSVGKHVSPFLGIASGKTWCGFVGNHRDVTIVHRNSSILRFIENKWQFIYLPILEELLHRHLEEASVIDQIIKLLFALSGRRVGALILILAGTERPRPVASIDSSALRQEISNSVRNKRLDEIMANNSALGVLGSDGLTTIDRNGTIVGSGEIIELNSSVAAQPSGGGRTQAASSASHYGLAVKISEDGPISFFERGAEILRVHG